MFSSPRARHRASVPPPRSSGFFATSPQTAVDRARSRLARDGQVIVVALCAERALVSLHLNPSEYHAFDVGPVDAKDPLNAAHYYRVRPRLPSAAS
jgi:hypothetical protein